ADYGAEYEVRDGTDAMRAVAAARLREGGLQPAVGDWVALTYRPGTPLISGVLERRTTFSRKTASVETKQQVLAANVDVALVVASAQDVNARRIERYLTMAWQSGAAPVVVLTKADLAESADALRVELETAAAGSPVVVTSSVSGEGVDEVAAQLRPSRTGVLLGPSGAGKSSLINRLLGREAMKTRAVHATGEGRHMTSHRELFELPGGGVIIDTPGLREAQLWSGEGALGSLFDDVEDLARQCRFADCRHETEPGRGEERRPPACRRASQVETDHGREPRSRALPAVMRSVPPRDVALRDAVEHAVGLRLRDLLVVDERLEPGLEVGDQLRAELRLRHTLGLREV